MPGGTYPRRLCFFFNDTATTEIYTLSLHDALPISPRTVMGKGSGVTPRQSHTRHGGRAAAVGARAGRFEDRKSTRLNSSHANISYAVFCLKKKKDHPPVKLSRYLGELQHSAVRCYC